MRIFWTLLKVIIGLAIAIPIGLFVLALTVGLVRTLVRLAVMAFVLACVAFVGLSLFRVMRRLFWSSPAQPEAPVVHDLPRADPYYEAAMREIDSELGHQVR